MNLLEIACFTPEAALIAAKSGAHRIEFCSEIETGGLTPSFDDFIELKRQITIPIFVMIRPRAGDYVYDEEELDQMFLELETFKHFGADGFVFGALTKDGLPDIDACKSMLAEADELPCTFHRAFDEVSDWKLAMGQLADAGFKRILTSGRPGSASEHASLLHEMNDFANGAIIILPGGGIRSTTIAAMRSGGSFNEFHSSGITVKNSDQPNEVEIKALLASIKN